MYVWVITRTLRNTAVLHQDGQNHMIVVIYLIIY